MEFSAFRMFSGQCSSVRWSKPLFTSPRVTERKSSSGKGENDLRFFNIPFMSSSSFSVLTGGNLPPNFWQNYISYFGHFGCTSQFPDWSLHLAGFIRRLRSFCSFSLHSPDSKTSGGGLQREQRLDRKFGLHRIQMVRWCNARWCQLCGVKDAHPV